MSLEEKKLKMRQRRWVHYPGAEEQNLDRDVFRDAERVVYREEKREKGRPEKEYVESNKA